MPVFLDGQQNLAALTVPGVYGDIILPTPMILGKPTNLIGLVGVASWGPLNGLIPASQPSDAAVSMGPPKVRNNDIATHIAAASQVGGAVGFLCIRVSDGTDVAASAAIGTGGTFASATATFSANPTAADTLTIAGTAITFTSAIIGSTLAKTLATLLELLQNSNDTNLITCTYSLSGSVLTIKAASTGTAGNSITLAKSSTAITISGSVLSGGAGSGGTGITITAKYTGTLGNQIQVAIQNGTLASSYMAMVSFPGLQPEIFNNIAGSGNTFWVNLAAAINSGNATRGPSRIVVATAGAATAAPTTGATTTLSSGTDGDSGVTDATLMGQDVVPRKGMYALRSSGVAAFTLVDLSTAADYAAIASFGLSELAYPVFATVSGDTIANALATRVSAGVDTEWFKLILGDWPTFYDSYNGLSRLVNPTAFCLGRLGNLSPQQSTLNKPLLGISSTQKSQTGQTYSDAELSLINQGGIDVILAPPSTVGGNYYAMGTGRNAASNTAANGDEYTTMTNFLMGFAEGKAAGSFVGQLQSIQPNDQTRAQVKALFDGFSAQLADPNSGLGINGQGMIDSWATQCDLNNNPPGSQAAGYLFVYWVVRYLNVIRYLVVKFAGGGNVTVSIQQTPPSPSQFS